ncbi:hypothetical protein J3R30DRAFT_1818208 [Lentinula aciculospora]|uniref:Late embryogenesis abundant protein n=1 Tax=Lentinula aciculospora TaxID=153920 RepID=A0A9W9ALW8_9AGAR|nr:hypothetical protein J3R30DRAFT_1818208 [Lentinula aciculospora]
MYKTCICVVFFFLLEYYYGFLVSVTDVMRILANRMWFKRRFPRFYKVLFLYSTPSQSVIHNMYRSQAIRFAQTSSSKAGRTYSTEVPKSKSNNGLLIATLVAAVGAGGYWYYSNPNEVATLESKAKKDEEEAIKKAREAGSAGKARIEDAYKIGQLKFDEAKASADKTIADAEARAKQTANDAKAKFDDYKSNASRSLSNAKDSTENLYNEARASVDNKYGEAKGSVEEKKESAKAGWFSWLGWGKSTAEDAKKSSAEKVADVAGDVQAKASKRT